MKACPLSTEKYTMNHYILSNELKQTVSVSIDHLEDGSFIKFTPRSKQIYFVEVRNSIPVAFYPVLEGGKVSNIGELPDFDSTDFIVGREVELFVPDDSKLLLELKKYPCGFGQKKRYLNEEFIKTIFWTMIHRINRIKSKNRRIKYLGKTSINNLNFFKDVSILVSERVLERKWQWIWTYSLEEVIEICNMIRQYYIPN